MKAFARITAGFFLFLGGVIILIGIIFILSSFASLKDIFSPTTSVIPILSGLTALMRIFTGAIIGVQGLFTAAIGQVIWLLIDISDQTEQTNQHLLALFRQIYKPNSYNMNLE